MKILQFNFPMEVPFSETVYAAFKELAADIAAEEGLVWKVWMQNEQTQEVGGIYLFADAINAQRYLEKHSARLESFGIGSFSVKIFDVNEPLSLIDRATLQ